MKMNSRANCNFVFTLAGQMILLSQIKEWGEREESTRMVTASRAIDHIYWLFYFVRLQWFSAPRNTTTTTTTIFSYAATRTETKSICHTENIYKRRIICLFLIWTIHNRKDEKKNWWQYHRWIRVYMAVYGIRSRFCTQVVPICHCHISLVSFSQKKNINEIK